MPPFRKFSQSPPVSTPSESTSPAEGKPDPGLEARNVRSRRTPTPSESTSPAEGKPVHVRHVRSRRTSPSELVETTKKKDEKSAWKEKILKDKKAQIALILLSGTLTGGLAHVVGVHSITGLLAAHGLGEGISAEVISEMKALDEQEKIEYHLEYMGKFINFLLLEHMKGKSKEEKEEEILKLITTPKIYDINLVQGKLRKKRKRKKTNKRITKRKKKTKKRTKKK